ncbi:MAG: porin [Acetobacteraceae bacterium]|nr:porin [Acetobacteraceae bacterium]
MRKSILAASTALTIVGLAGAAVAQTTAPVNPLIAGAPPGLYGVYGPSSAPSATNMPGTVQAYVRGRLYFDAAILADSADNLSGKSSSYSIGAAARLYWGFQGTTAQGLTYGAFIETRHNSGGATASGNTGAATFKVQRAVGFVAGSWGTFRFGGSDDPIALLMTGTFEGIGDTTWNGDLGGLVHASTLVNWPFAENSGTYANPKLVYLSPRWNGFDFGVGFTPSSNGVGYPQTATGGLGDPRTTSASVGTFIAGNGDLRRSRNLVTAAARYAGAMGPVGVVIEGGVATGSTIKNSGLTGLTTSGAAQYGYRNPLAFDAGMMLTYGGFAVGGHLVTGSINPNGSNNLMPVAKGKGSSTAFTVGASYVTGAWGFSTSFLRSLTPGAYAEDFAGLGTFGKRSETGYVAAVSYGWAPNATLSLSYEYGARRQTGFNFYNPGKSAVGNNTKAQGLILTNYFQW